MMNDIREILTKAVIGKGQKAFDIEISLPPTPTLPDRTLGAFIMNHQMEVAKSGNLIELTGTYDVHVWYSHSGDTETEIAKTTIEYGNLIELKDALRPNLLISDEILSEEIIAPYATEIRVEEGIIKGETRFEIGVEVIGETKMRVAILGPVVEQAPSFVTPEVPTTTLHFDDLSEIDAAINDNFLDSQFGGF